MEKVIAYHCGPALAGIKTANLVSINKNKFPHAISEVNALNAKFNKKGIYFECICQCEERLLILVYREKLLDEYLKNEDIAQILRAHGYPDRSDVREHLEFLKSRMKNQSFPHEIGAFLGYPVDDIKGFIDHRDEGVLLVGEWKVYSDVDRAKRTFRRYCSCRNALVRRIDSGARLEEIFCVA